MNKIKKRQAKMKSLIRLSVIISVTHLLITMSKAQWCVEKKRVAKTRLQWNEGERFITKRDFFLRTKLKRVPYVFTSKETYYEYVPERVCCTGYHQMDDNCEPTCYPNCSANSTCFKPNLCRCTVGYYGNDDHPLLIKCNPYCEELCPPNSKCTAPNTCTCLEDYRKSPSGGEHCEPICSHSCDINAYCEKPEFCACKKGYEMIDNRCEPICLQPCPDQARCIEPNRCLCMEGYQMQLTSRYEHYCEPICEVKCSTFGKCVAPNKCECFNDYKLNTNTSICEPICSYGCENGQCLSPNMCVCNKGYLMGPDNKCQPICSQSCKQGRCIRPEQCECEKGFRLAKNSTVLCQPICESPCTNGDCVAPNFCVCHKDYKHPDDYKYHICEKIISSSTSTSETTEDFTETSTTTEIYTMTETTTDSLKLLKDDFTTSTVNYITEELISKSISSNTGIKFPQTSNDSNTFTSVTECFEHCQCWQEYDDFGPLSTTTCTAICTYENNEQCLRDSLCKCDWKLKRMICHLADEESFDDIPSLYQCKASALTAKVPELEKRSTEAETSTYLLWLGIGSGLTILVILTSCIVYWKFSTRNSDYLVQYEQQNSN